MKPVATIVMLAGLALGGSALDKLANAEPSAATTAPTKAAANDLVIGEFPLLRVVDGDTVRVKGLDSSLRLLGIDTEETFKHDKERRAYAKGFAAYAKEVRGASPRPAKFATPLGDEAKKWAEAWFQDVTTVRLERDDAHEIKDRYRRYLAYVLAEKHGKWLNYNVEAVRAGMSPYFPKYGRSRRFDRDFIAAEAEAKAAKRGIWAAGAEAYPDYPEREAWWAARGDFVAKFHDEAARSAAHSRDAKHATMIDLTHDDAPALLEANVGHEVIVLGTVGEIEVPGAPSHKKHGRHRATKARNHDASAGDAGGDEPTDQNDFADGWAGDPDGVDDSGDEGGEAESVSSDKWSADNRPADNRPHGKAPTRVILDNHIPLVVFDPDIVAASGITAWKGEWIRVTGKPSLYHGKVEIVIDRTAQIELCPVPGLTKPSNHEKSVPIHAP